MSNKPLILVTNDDGIDSPGLHALVGGLVGSFELIIAAPAADMSGSGTGIGRFDISEGVELTPVDIEPDIRAYTIDGPPGLAVTAAALGAFGDLPELVVSGINAGVNTGHSIIHSGTVELRSPPGRFKCEVSRSASPSPTLGIGRLLLTSPRARRVGFSIAESHGFST